MLTKRCHKCGTDKPLDEFHRNQGRRYGRSGRCKECQKEYGAAHYKTPHGRLRQMAASIIRRVNKHPHYQHVECLIGSTTDEIYNYLAPRFLADVAAIMAAGEIPSVDRIDSMGGYEDGNIRIISKRRNEERGGTTAKMRLGYPVYVIWPDGRQDLYGSLREAAGQLETDHHTIRYLIKTGRMSKKFGCRIERVGGGAS